jgi:hypothetical protein
LPLVPVALLFALGLIVWLARHRAERVVWAVSVGGQWLVWLSLIALRGSVPSELQFSVWRPLELFQTPLVLKLDVVGWTMAFAIATLLLAIGLTSAARQGSATPLTRMFLSTYGALCMAAVMAGNLLTMAVIWATMEVVAFASSILLVARRDIIPREIVRLGVQGTSVVLVLAAAVLLGDGTSAAAPGMEVWAYSVGLAAVALRIGLFPAHYPLPSLPGIRRGLGTSLRLLPAAMATVLLVRLAQGSPPQPILTAMAWLGGLAAVGSGLSWAFHGDPVERRPILVLGLVAAAMCGAGLARDAAPSVAAGSATLVLVGGMVSLAEPHEDWHRFWVLAAAFLVLGGPLSPGQAEITSLVHGVSAGGAGVAAILGLVGLLFLTLGILRQFDGQVTPWGSGEDLVRTSYVVGVLLPLVSGAAIAIVTGLFPSLRSIAAFSALAGASALLYYAYARAGARLRGVLLTQLGSLKWPAIPVEVDLKSASPLRALVWIGNLLQGDAGLLWILFFLLVLAAIAGRG